MDLNFELIKENFDFNKEKGILRGVAVPCDKICGDFRRIKFNKESLQNNVGKTVPFFGNHEARVGNIYGKTEFLEVTSDGLLFETQLYTDRSDINDIINPIKDGILKGVSIGVDIDKYEMDPKKDVMTVTRCQIKELSLTHDPAFKEAGISSFFEKEEKVGFFFGLSFEDRNKYLDDIQDLKGISKLLKYCGFSEENTKIIIGKIKSFRKEDKENESFSEGENKKMKEILNEIRIINKLGKEND